MEKDECVIWIPAEGNYIEILGHRIDGHNSFEEFVEELQELKSIRKRYKELEKKECKFIRQDYDWIVYDCSNCKESWVYEDGTPEDNSYNYCPKCGAKIVGVEELLEDDES